MRSSLQIYNFADFLELIILRDNKKFINILNFFFIIKENDKEY